MDFEEINEELENIIEKLESGEITLSKGLELYERAKFLINESNKKLTEAKIKLETINAEEE